MAKDIQKEIQSHGQVTPGRRGRRCKNIGIYSRDPQRTLPRKSWEDLCLNFGLGTLVNVLHDPEARQSALREVGLGPTFGALMRIGCVFFAFELTVCPPGWPNGPQKLFKRTHPN